MPSSVGSPRRRSPSPSGRRSGRFSPHKHTPSHSPRRHTPPSTPRKRWIHSEHLLTESLPKCSSEPLLPGTPGGRFEVESSSSVPDGLFFRQMTYNDLFSPPTHLLSSESLQNHNEHGYQKDVKVVVGVTVEGSSGPIRTLVKLGSTVEETIKLVIDLYGKEGRSPHLDNTSASAYDLHISYFSLECLDRQDPIGSSGSRNFYLRKGRIYPDQKSSSSATTEIGPARESYLLLQSTQPVVFLPAYINRKMTKFMRKMQKVWKLIGCLH